MEIKKFDTFLEGLARTDKDLKTLERTKKLDQWDFLDILNENCKNFSFENTQLWRSRVKKYDLELFTPAPRNADPLAFKDFFNEIEFNTDEYPVVRKNSLIGGTNKEICKTLVGCDMYLVIPFDNSEIVFCPMMDMWAMSDDRRNYSGKNMMVNGRPISKDNFTKVSYTKDFQYLDKGKSDNGCEFFISSPCLLVHESKIDWLKENLK
jgi:hypothetical protein